LKRNVTNPSVDKGDPRRHLGTDTEEMIKQEATIERGMSRAEVVALKPIEGQNHAEVREAEDPRRSQFLKQPACFRNAGNSAAHRLQPEISDGGPCRPADLTVQKDQILSHCLTSPHTKREPYERHFEKRITLAFCFHRYGRHCGNSVLVRASSV
jgi:hypothetical protein